MCHFNDLKMVMGQLHKNNCPNKCEKKKNLTGGIADWNEILH